MSQLQALNSTVPAGFIPSAPAPTAPDAEKVGTTPSKLRAACLPIDPEQAVGAADWNRLAGDVPFRQFAWQTNWWRHYAGRASKPWTLTVRNDSGELVGLLPLFMQTSPIAGRVLQLLGSGEVCSDYLTLMARPAFEPAVVDAVVECLSGELGQRWDSLLLDGIAAEDRNVQLLQCALAKAGHQVVVRQPCSTWRIALPGAWAEYVAALSKRRRDWVKKLQKQYFDSGRAVLKVVETAADFELAWPVFQELHQKRRQSLGEQGCFASTPFDQFHTEQARQLLAAGQLRLHIIELDGQPAAGEYGIVSGKSVYLYQSGFEPALGKHKPGWLNTMASLRRAIDQQMEVVDFMRGDEPYKASWLAQPCPLHEVRVVGRHAMARLRQGVLTLGASVRRQWRRYHEATPKTGNQSKE